LPGCATASARNAPSSASASSARPWQGGSNEGVSPCSWTAWLAELDRQQLALKVDMAADDFELVDRRQTN
jgi:hypothetical protein